jgi:hypothetical protein
MKRRVEWGLREWYPDQVLLEELEGVCSTLIH